MIMQSTTVPTWCLTPRELWETVNSWRNQGAEAHPINLFVGWAIAQTPLVCRAHGQDRLQRQSTLRPREAAADTGRGSVGMLAGHH